jgi:riboflavin synthase
MFTGIVQEVGRVTSLRPDGIVIAAGDILKGITLGGSVAVNGACLTVTSFDSNSFSAGLTPETLNRTNLGQLNAGDKVNLERPLALGGELGGHLVQGHIDGTGTVASIIPEGNAIIFQFNAPPEIMRYIVEKGFIAVDGMSLTVSERGASYFKVSIVDYTMRNTILSGRKEGDTVNLEVDIMAKYAEQFTRTGYNGITSEYLREKGF